MVQTKEAPRLRRKKGIRTRIYGTTARPRLTVFRSSKHIYAQVIDDHQAKSLVSASTLTKAVQQEIGELSKQEAAKLVGKALAEACFAKGIKQVVFDRNGYMYHGRISALAEGAREAGLDF